MSVGFLDLVRVSLSTTGTGSTLTINAAIAGWLNFTTAGGVNGTVYRYAIIDGNNSEIGTATYNSGTNTLSGRTVTKSTNSNLALNLTSNAILAVSVAAEDLVVGGTNYGTMAAQAASAVAITGGTLVGISGNVGFGTSAPDSPLHVSRNAAAAPGSLPAGSLVHLQAVDGVPAVFYADTFGNGANPAGTFMGVRANGTAASPSALTTNDVIAQFSAKGWHSGAAYSAVRGTFNFFAAEPWTSLAQGTYAQISTTLIGTTTNAARLTIDGNAKFGFNIASNANANYLFNVGTNLDFMVRSLAGLLEVAGVNDSVGSYIPLHVDGAPLNLQLGNPSQPVNVGQAGGGGLMNLNYRNFIMTVGEPAAVGVPVLQSYTSGGGAGNWDTQLTWSGGVAGTQGRGVFGWNGIFSSLTVSNTLDAGFVVTQQPGGTLPSERYFNGVNTTNWNVNNAGFPTALMASNLFVNGTSNVGTGGGVFSFAGRTIVQTLGTAAANGSWNGILGQVVFATNVPGGATNVGGFGINSNVVIVAGVTGVGEITAFESDHTVQGGANPLVKIAYKTVFDPSDAAQGSLVDASHYWTKGSGGSTPGWQNLFMLDFTNTAAGVSSGNIISTTASLFTTRGIASAPTIGNGFLIDTFTISGYAWKSPNHFVFGGGSQYMNVPVMQTTFAGQWGGGSFGTVPTPGVAGSGDTFFSAGYGSADSTARTVPYNTSGILLGNALQATLYVGNTSAGTGDPTPQGTTQTVLTSSIKANAAAGSSVYGQTGGQIVVVTGGWAGSSCTFDIASVTLSTGSRTITVSAAPTNHHYVAGMPVVFKSGTGSLAASTVIAVVNSPTSVTLSANPTGNGTATLTFWAGTPVTAPVTTTPTVPNGAYNPFAGTPGDTFAVNGQVNLYDNGLGIGQWLQCGISQFSPGGSTPNFKTVLTMGMVTQGNLTLFGAGASLTSAHQVAYIAQFVTGGGGYGVFIAGPSGSTFNFAATGTGHIMDSSFTVSTPSEPSIKRDIERLPSVLGAVMAIDPVTFRYREDWREQDHRLGFLARDDGDLGGVCERLPATLSSIVVTPDDVLGCLGLKQSDMMPILWRGVQEVVDRINGLEARVSALEAPAVH